MRAAPITECQAGKGRAVSRAAVDVVYRPLAALGNPADFFLVTRLLAPGEAREARSRRRGNARKRDPQPARQADPESEQWHRIAAGADIDATRNRVAAGLGWCADARLAPRPRSPGCGGRAVDTVGLVHVQDAVTWAYGSLQNCIDEFTDLPAAGPDRVHRAVVVPMPAHFPAGARA